MHIDLTGHHLDITDSLRDFVNQKFDKIERHSDIIIDAHAVLSVEKNRHKAEATLKLRGSSVFAEAEDEDMYVAIDALVDKLDRQVRKHKDKMVDHHARDAQKAQLHDIEVA